MGNDFEYRADDDHFLVTSTFSDLRKKSQVRRDENQSKRNPGSQQAGKYLETIVDQYSVPVEHGNDQLVLRAYPFRVEILLGEKMIATHLRCFGREQDVLDPLHYLTLLEQRPGAFEHAKPLRRWRKYWPQDYDRLLEALRTRLPDGRGVKEFIAVLKLHRDHPADQVEQAVHAALELGAASLDGVTLYLRQLQRSQPLFPTLETERFSDLAAFGNQPVNLQQYDLLVAR